MGTPPPGGVRVGTPPGGGEGMRPTDGVRNFSCVSGDLEPGVLRA